MPISPGESSPFEEVMSFKIVLRDILVLLAVGAAALGLVSVLPAQELSSSALPGNALADNARSASKASVIPPAMRFSGIAANRAGDTVEATFSIYSVPEGGEPLWSETQRLAIAADGKYAVLLGAASQTGLPPQLFAAGQSRWVGVSIERAPELPRTPLVAVPYAMKAADADTVGGLTAADLVTQRQFASLARQLAANAAQFTGPAPQVTPPTGAGGTNYLPLWTGASTLADSALYQGGTAQYPEIGINTTGPVATLDVNGKGNFRGNLQLFSGINSTPAAAVNSPQLVFYASSYLLNGSRPITQTFAWQAIAANNNTSAPTANLTLLSGQTGSALAPTGLEIYPDGVIQFAPGQTYPGSITSVEPGIGLTGGGSSGNVELTVDTGLVPLMTSANKFSAKQSFNAGLSASGVAVTGTSSFTGPTTFQGTTTFTGAPYGLTATGTPSGANNGAGVAGYGTTGLIGFGGSYGVEGIALASTPQGEGVYASADGPQASAFYGHGNGTGGFGVQVFANGAGGTGVWTQAALGTGLYSTGSLGMSVTGWAYGGQITANAPDGIGLSATVSGQTAVGVSAAGNGYSGIGVTATGGMAGVSARSPNIGMEGTETNATGTGVYGAGEKPSNQMRGIFQQVYPQGSLGVWGDTGAPRNSSAVITAGVLGSADNNTAIAGFNASDLATLWVFNYGTGPNQNDVAPVIHAGGRHGDCLVTSKGDSICTGAHKTAVPVSGGQRQVEMYAMHAAENWFEDFGAAQLAHGAAVVQIDPAFAETINGQLDYQVFLTPRGDCEGLYVTNQTATSFEVRELRKGASSVSFNYRITARRAGHESERMIDVTQQMKRDPRFDKAMEPQPETAQ